MSDTDFRLEVGGEYVDGTGEKHTCVEHDGANDLFFCDGKRTGRGVYYPTGQLYLGDSATRSEKAAPQMTLRAITE